MLFQDELLTQSVRDAIHQFALDGRALLTREAHDLLEGVYGLHGDGHLEAAENLPVLADPAARQTYDSLQVFLEDEREAGLPPDEVVAKLVKEIAFTHLNRLVAFKMLETSRLIREAVGRGINSTGFKYYLADHAAEEARWRAGQVESAYQGFLLWLAGEVAREIPVLFDPANLVSGFFPRPPVLQRLLTMLNDPALAPAWQAEETIGWVYQYFNEPELQAAFAAVRLSGVKFAAKDIPSATQLFTPRWVVRYLVENTLGRLWVNMHPDSALAAGLRYLVPAPGEALPEPLRPVRDIRLLDPACGTMHFGLVAFDLFVEMYREELLHAGQPGWPPAPSVAAEADIPAAIIEHNLHGIDLDLRAVQLSALTLYLKAKRLNHAAKLSDHNLACADVLPFSMADLGKFLLQMRFTDPIFERMLRRVRAQLGDIQQVGSLLRIERELSDLVSEKQRKDQQRRQARYGNTPGLFDAQAEADLDASHYAMLEVQLVQALNFFRQQAAEQGENKRFFVDEAAKSLRVLDLFMQRYDVVVTNPPYLSRRKMNDTLAKFLDEHYPEGKGDLFAAFIQRCLELTEETGYVGMLTMHSFMFISSYQALRTYIVDQANIETLAHLGPGFFATGNPGTLQTTAFVLRREADPARRAAHSGVYFRLVHAPDADAKRQMFERALETLKE